MKTKLTGDIAESKCYCYLTENKYKILEKNYKNLLGEIDIIAFKDKYVIFIEVKYKSSLKFGYPREMVTPYKQNKIRNVAQLYLKTNKLMESNVRFDVLEVLDDEINHLKNCF